MRSRLFGLWCALLLLSACHPPLQEIPLSEVPVGPLLQPLVQQRDSFRGMKAVARVEVQRKSRKRVYESVAILEQSIHKLKVEGYGPLGSRLFALLWDGNAIQALRPGETEPYHVGSFGLESMLGIAIAPQDLCSILSGNIPAVPDDAEVTAGCASAGWCAVDVRGRDRRWKFRVRPTGGPHNGPRLEGVELFSGDRPAFRSMFFYPPGVPSEQGTGPERIVVTDSDRGVSLLVLFEEADWNVPVDDGLFTLSFPEGNGR